MDGLMLGSVAPIPATTQEVLFGLGFLLLLGAVYAWTQRDVFAKRRREGFRKQGWEWAARQMDDGRWRRVAVFFAILWGSIGSTLVVAGVVSLFVPGY